MERWERFVYAPLQTARYTPIEWDAFQKRTEPTQALNPNGEPVGVSMRADYSCVDLINELRNYDPDSVVMLLLDDGELYPISGVAARLDGDRYTVILT